jgi:hypothetical protein
MASEKPREPVALPSLENIDNVVAYRRALEAVGPVEIVRDQDFGGCAYHAAIEALLRAFGENNFVQPFDWPGWQSEAESLVNNPSLMRTASLKDCVRLITTHVRKERFCAGHFGSMVRRGHIAAILQRLATIRGLASVNIPHEQS